MITHDAGRQSSSYSSTLAKARNSLMTGRNTNVHRAVVTLHFLAPFGGTEGHGTDHLLMLAERARTFFVT
jgi:hypothetical protein